MHLTGRFENIRMLGPHGLGQPYILDRKQGVLLPYRCDEWVQHKGMWYPVPRGGVGFGQSEHVYGGSPTYLGYPFAQGGPTSVALDSAYVAGVSGDAIAARLFLATAKTLVNVYFYIFSFGGTAANVNDLNLEVRAMTGNTLVTTTAPGLLASGTYNPASVVGWHKIPVSIALAAGTYYAIIIGDADGTATDFASVANGSAVTEVANPMSYASLMGFQTTGGFASGTGFNARMQSLVLEFSDGTVRGWPFGTIESPPNNALQMGLYLDGLTDDLDFFTIDFTASTANQYSGVNVWEGATGPAGSPYRNTTLLMHSTVVAAQVTALFQPVVRLRKRTPYSLVITKNAVIARPNRYGIGAGVDATLRKAMIGSGLWGWQEEIAGPAWSPNFDRWPHMALGIHNQADVGPLLGGGMVS